MAEEDFPDFAAIAQEAAKELLSGLHVEEQIIAEEHDLKLKLLVWDNIIEHLNTLISEKSQQHTLLLKVIDKSTDIRDLIDSYNVEELKLVAEEKGIVKKLESDIPHRKWKLVKIEEKQAKGKAKEFEKLEIKELKKLKVLFLELALLISKSKAIKIKTTDTRTDIEKFKKEEEYYFLQIWRFATTYYTVISNLITKEELLLEKIK